MTGHRHKTNGVVVNEARMKPTYGLHFHFYPLSYLAGYQNNMAMEPCHSSEEDAANSGGSDNGDYTEAMQRSNQHKSTLLQSTEDDNDGYHHSRVLDHYSLPTPSSTVRFRSTNVHVYDSQGSQLIMEERLTAKNNAAGGKTASLQEEEGSDGGEVDTTTTTNVTLKRVVYSSPEMLFLRGLYSVIAFFMGSFLFIFAIGLLLFIISDLANQAREIIVYGTEGKGELRLFDIIYPRIVIF